MPELRHLRAFVAVAQELNFTRAAARLHLGQQAVSKTVRQLERELGVTLLERTTREVRLTPAGAALLETAPGVLRAADAAFARAQEVGRGLSGTVRVGVSPAVGPSEREEVVRALREEAPELSVSLARCGRGRSARHCARGRSRRRRPDRARGIGDRGGGAAPHRGGAARARRAPPGGAAVVGAARARRRAPPGVEPGRDGLHGRAGRDARGRRRPRDAGRVAGHRHPVAGRAARDRCGGADAAGWPDDRPARSGPPRRGVPPAAGRALAASGPAAAGRGPPAARRGWGLRALSRAAGPGASRPRPGRPPRTPAWRSARPARCRCRARRSPRWWGSNAARPRARPAGAPRAGTRGR